MGQLLTNVNAKHGTSRMKLNNRQNKRCAFQPSLAGSKAIILGATALAILISIYTNRASLQFFWLEVMPSLWSFLYGIFTRPTNLFFFLNSLILSILALAHLHSSKSTNTSSTALAVNDSHLATSVNPDHSIEYVDEEQQGRGADGYGDPSVSDRQERLMRLNYDHEADSLQAMDANHDYQSAQDEYSGAVLINANHAVLVNKRMMQADADHTISTAASNLNQVHNQFLITAASAAKLSVTKEAISGDHLQSQLDQNNMQELCMKTRDTHLHIEEQTEKASPTLNGKAEKAGRRDYNGINVESVNDKLIDSLLTEEGSIFTHAGHSRPLASTRFTRKKAATPNDRPHSPLRISKPILKRGDTLDATWKAICESKRHSSPFNRPHPKYHTIEAIYDEVPIRKPSSLLSPITQRSKAKATTRRNCLHDQHELTQAHLLGKREPSMPQEELNEKVESFISRFNAQIKIQREKSLLEFMEMVGRGAS